MPDNLSQRNMKMKKKILKMKRKKELRKKIQKKRKMQVINPASFLILILETLLRFTMEN